MENSTENQESQSETGELALLRLYKEHECLWNKNNPHYNNAKLKQNALAEICALNIPNLSIVDVKKRINNLKTMYYKEKRLIKKAKEIGLDYTPELYWFKSADAFFSSMENELENCSTTKEETRKRKIWRDEDDNEFYFKLFNNPNYINDDQPDSEVIDNEESKTNKKKRKFSETVKKLDNTTNKLLKILAPADEGKLDRFATLVIDYLKEMPPKRQLRCQFALENILQSYRRENVNNAEDF